MLDSTSPLNEAGGLNKNFIAERRLHLRSRLVVSAPLNDREFIIERYLNAGFGSAQP